MENGKSWVSTGVKATGAAGQNGADGKDGVDGKDGADGKDGVDGKDGIGGKDGVDGKDGYSPVKGTDYFTDDEKEEMLHAVIAALPVYEGEVIKENNNES